MTTILIPGTGEQDESLFKQFEYSREKLQDDLIHIKEWLIKQHHLPPSRLKEKDNFLKMYITGCKGRLDMVKRKLDAYYTLRSYSNLYNCRDPFDPEYKLDKDYLYMCAMPKLEENQLLRVVILALANYELSKLNLSIFAKKLVSLGELRLRYDEICYPDFIIVDCTGGTIAHLIKLKPFLLRDLARIAQDALPLRYKAVLFINAPAFIAMTVNNLIKPLLTKKLKQRMIVTSNGYEEIYNYIDKNNLPKEFNSENKMTMKEIGEPWHEKEAEHRDWYINELSERNDESKRSTKNGNIKNPYQSVKVSLRKLVID